MQAGARHVYAVDFSAIVKQAKKIVEDNGLSDVITVIHGKIEEVELRFEIKLTLFSFVFFIKHTAHTNLTW